MSEASQRRLPMKVGRQHHAALAFPMHDNSFGAQSMFTLHCGSAFSCKRAHVSPRGEAQRPCTECSATVPCLTGELGCTRHGVPQSDPGVATPPLSRPQRPTATLRWGLACTAIMSCHSKSKECANCGLCTRSEASEVAWKDAWCCTYGITHVGISCAVQRS